MGRFWLGVGLLVLFFAVGIWVCYGMDQVHLSVSNDLEEAANQVLSGQWEEGVMLAQSAMAQWQAHWHSTAALADHAPMDEIDGLFSQLEVYSKAGLQADFAACCARLSSLVEAVGEAHRLSWWNLL